MSEAMKTSRKTKRAMYRSRSRKAESYSSRHGTSTTTSQSLAQLASSSSPSIDVATDVELPVASLPTSVRTRVQPEPGSRAESRVTSVAGAPYGRRICLLSHRSCIVLSCTTVPNLTAETMYVTAAEAREISLTCDSVELRRAVNH